MTAVLNSVFVLSWATCALLVSKLFAVIFRLFSLFESMLLFAYVYRLCPDIYHLSSYIDLSSS